MNYYYDITLNFLDDYYMFYEWDMFDNFEYYKKIPIFQVSNKAMKEVLSNKIKVSKEFLNVIKNKTKSNNGIFKYMAIFADKNSVIALEFNDEGLDIARSFLSVEDELNIIDILYTINMQKLDYEVISPLNFKNELRIEEMVKRLINTEIKSLANKNDFCKLKYLYMEWFNKIPSSIDEIVRDMKNKLKSDIGNKELKIYELIKLSYSNV